MKHIFSLIAVAFLVFIFTFYVDGEMGIILIAFLLTAPILSFILTFYARSRVNIKLVCDAYVKKGNELEIKIIIEKESRFPVAFIDVELFASGVFADNSKFYRASIFNEKKIEFSVKLPAVTGGNGQIGIKNAYSSGFLGFIKMKLTKELPENKSVGVIPEIPEINASSILFRSIADVVLTTEEDDENETTMLFSTNTAPGYEHREYVPGDSLKRINWKLSARKSNLMVRLDEAASAVQPSIILDLYRSKESDEVTALKNEEKTLQSVFGLMQLMLKQGIACTFIYRTYDGSTVAESVDNPDFLSQLLLKVLSVKVETESRISGEVLNNGVCARIIATSDLSESLDEIIDALPDKENSSIISPFNMSERKIQLPLWYLADNNNFELV